MLHTLWTVLTMKLPLILLVLVVWWAIHDDPEAPGTQDDDGGIRRPGQRSHPLKPFPRPPRRGPHGEPTPPSPPRIRTVHARARTYGR